MDSTSAGTAEAGRPVSLPGIVVEPAWLEERLGRPGLRVVDMRDEEAYTASHLPGAVRLDLASLGSARGGCDNVLLPSGDFASLMEAVGISSGDAVVAYDDQWGLAAARLVWALNFYGHSAVAVLDGGWDRWLAEDRPVTDESPPPTQGRFEATPNPEVGAELDWLAARVPGTDPVLIDTRSQTEFDQGHLPGAKWWDWFLAVPPASWNVARDLEELRAEWAGLGVEPEREIVVYCRSGMRAAHTYVVLKHARFPRVRLYDGSWQEWSMRGEGRSDG